MTTSRGKILQEKTSAGLARFLIPAKVVLGAIPQGICLNAAGLGAGHWVLSQRLGIDPQQSLEKLAICVSGTA
jgi:hypothetical protein